MLCNVKCRVQLDKASHFQLETTVLTLYAHKNKTECSRLGLYCSICSLCLAVSMLCNIREAFTRVLKLKKKESRKIHRNGPSGHPNRSDPHLVRVGEFSRFGPGNGKNIKKTLGIGTRLRLRYSILILNKFNIYLYVPQINYLKYV